MPNHKPARDEPASALGIGLALDIQALVAHVVVALRAADRDHPRISLLDPGSTAHVAPAWPGLSPCTQLNTHDNKHDSLVRVVRVVARVPDGLELRQWHQQVSVGAVLAQHAVATTQTRANAFESWLGHVTASLNRALTIYKAGHTRCQLRPNIRT